MEDIEELDIEFCEEIKIGEERKKEFFNKQIELLRRKKELLKIIANK